MKYKLGYSNPVLENEILTSEFGECKIKKVKEIQKSN